MRALRIIALSALALLPATAAFAQHNGNATMCQPNSVSAGFVERNQYGIANISATSAAQVYCPVNISSGPGNVFKTMVYARNPNVPVTCQLHILDGNGNDITTPETKSVTGANNSGAQPLEFFTMPTAPPTNAVMFCTIPPMSNGTPSYVTWFGWILS